MPRQRFGLPRMPGRGMLLGQDSGTGRLLPLRRVALVLLACTAVSEASAVPSTGERVVGRRHVLENLDEATIELAAAAGDETAGPPAATTEVRPHDACPQSGILKP